MKQRNVLPWSIWDFLGSLIATVLIVEMSVEGYIPPGVGAFWLVALVIYRALAPVLRCLAWPVRIVVYGPLILVLIWHGGYRYAVALVFELFLGGAGTILGYIFVVGDRPLILFALYFAVLGILTLWLANKIIKSDSLNRFLFQLFKTVLSILAAFIVVFGFLAPVPKVKEAVLTMGLLMIVVLVSETIGRLVLASAYEIRSKN